MLAACAALLVSAPALYAQSTITLPGTIIASDLNNPRGLAISPNGSLYVVEAGRGGDGPCIPDPAPPNGLRCFGATGAITEIDLKHNGDPHKLVTGLPSLSEGGIDAIGPAHVSFQGNKAYVTVGWGGDPANRALQLGTLGTVFGHTITVTPNGKWSLDVDVAAFEGSANPDGAAPDSDLFGIVAAPGRQIVADAGANAVFNVSANGTVSTLAVFPKRGVTPPPFIPGLPNPFPMESVPTSVAIGPGGDLYVGELTGFPFPNGGANIYRIHDGAVSLYQSGFTNIIDLEFDASGSLYVLEISKAGLLSPDPTGALFRIAPDGTKTEIKVVDPLTQENLLVAPGGVAIGRDGALYITINTNQPFVGGVLRVQP
jgi:hypothetical protein